MTLVHIAGYLRQLGDPAPLPDGELVIEYVVGSEGLLTIDGPDVTVPTPVRVRIVDGEPATPLELEPTRGTCAVRWEFRAPGYSFDRHTSVPDTAEVDFGDLPDVDPASFLPVTEPASILSTVQAELLDGVRLQRITQDAYDALPTPRPDDVLYVITPS